MLEWCSGSPEVEGEALVGHRIEKDSTRLQLAEVGLDRSDRVLAVLEEMIGDDEVLRSCGYGRELLSIVDDVHWSQVPLGELGVLPPQVIHAHPIDVSRRSLRWHHEWLVKWADLQALSGEKSCG